MPKYFANVVYVIEAEDLDTAREVSEQIARNDPDADFETSWVDEVEETDEFNDEEEYDD